MKRKNVVLYYDVSQQGIPVLVLARERTLMIGSVNDTGVIIERVITGKDAAFIWKSLTETEKDKEKPSTDDDTLDLFKDDDD